MARCLAERVLIFILVLLLVILALILAKVVPRLRLRLLPREPVRGGADKALLHTGHMPREMHPLGVAIEKYARTLGPEHVIGPHPLTESTFTAVGGEAAATGGAKKAAPKKPPKAKKPWTEYATWEDMRGDPGAEADYLAQRAAVLDNPNLDWTFVLRKVVPKLSENREYIGIINLDADGRTLQLEAQEPSPVEAGTTQSETAFAEVPAELVKKYAERPALFFFHTHPADPRAHPLPSSHDLVLGAWLAGCSRFAASVVISRYGVIVYGLEWSAYKAVNEAKDWRLAMLHLCYDVSSAHEAIRSWEDHTIGDYLGFYPRHRLLLLVYPTPEMVSDSHRYTLGRNLEHPTDHDLVSQYRDDIIEHRKTRRPAGEKGARAKASALPPPEAFASSPSPETSALSGM
jgi:hypothetical protein